MTDHPPHDATPSGREKLRLTRFRSRAVDRACAVGRVTTTMAAPAPVTLIIIGAMTALLLAAAITGADTRQWEPALAIGIDPIRDLGMWTALTSLAFTPDATTYVVIALFLVVVAVPLESRMGWRRFAALGLSIQVVATLFAIGLAEAASAVDGYWLNRFQYLTYGPVPAVIGVAMAATATMSPLWRRRIRVGVLSAAMVLVSFVGGLFALTLLVAGVVGIAVGRGLSPTRQTRRRPPPGTRSERRLLVAMVVAVTAVGPVIALATGMAQGPLTALQFFLRSQSWSAGDIEQLCSPDPLASLCRNALLSGHLDAAGPTVMAVMPSVLLLIAADGLRRGRRSAWIITVLGEVALLAVSATNAEPWVTQVIAGNGAHTTTTPYYIVSNLAPLVVPLVVLVVLLSNRRVFTVTTPGRALRRAALAIATIVGAAGVLYLGVGTMRPDVFQPMPSTRTVLLDFVARLMPPLYLQPHVLMLPTTNVSTLLFDWIGVAVWVGVCAAIATTFLAPSYGEDKAHMARAALSASSGSSLAWMTTWPGNHYWFSPDHRSYIAFRVIGGVALTTGGPVGPVGDADATVTGFARYAADNGWTPCLYSITADVRRHTDELGWSAVQVAEETVLDLPDLTFTGKKFQDVRTALNRAAKTGITPSWVRFATASDEVRRQIIEISEEWIGDKSIPEMGFTLGGLAELEDPAVRCLIAIDDDGAVHGVTSWMPVHRDGRVVGWTLDFMRRRTTGFRPVMEYLIASAAIDFKEEGYDLLSLSGAPLAKVPNASDAAHPVAGTALDNLLEILGRALEPVYGFRSLLAFKGKFQPRYEPIFMAYPDSAALPSIANAISRAFLPDLTVYEGTQIVRTMLTGGSRA